MSGTVVKKRVKIVSDGTVFGTKVCVDGKPLEGVSRIEWSIDSRDGRAKARINVDRVELDIEGDGAEIAKHAPASKLMPWGCNGSMVLVLDEKLQ